MKIKKVFALFFSPTGTTQKAVVAFAEGTGAPVEKIDLTLPATRRGSISNVGARHAVPLPAL